VRSFAPLGRRTSIGCATSCLPTVDHGTCTAPVSKTRPVTSSARSSSGTTTRTPIRGSSSRIWPPAHPTSLGMGCTRGANRASRAPNVAVGSGR
jgi:hypothetical protein